MVRARDPVGVAAAVEEHQYLRSCVERLLDGAGQAWPEEVHAIVGKTLAFLGKIHHFHVGKPKPRRSLAQHVECACPAFGGVEPALEARRRAPHHDRALRELRAPDRHVAAVVARHLVLLVAAVVFLIHHHQAELPVWDRREHRAARAHHQSHLPAGHHVPLLVALRGGEPAVEDGHALVREARQQPAAGLRRERDLGHQHERGAPGRKRLRDEPHVDLGLARARHAEEEVLREAGVQRGAHRIHHGALRGRELGHGARAGALGTPLGLHAGAALGCQDSRGNKAFHGLRGAQLRAFRQVAHVHGPFARCGRPQRLHHALLLRRDPLRGTHRVFPAVRQVHERARHRAHAALHRGGRHGRKRHTHRAHVVRGDPLRKLHQLRGHRRRGGRAALDELELRKRHVRCRICRHHAHHHALHRRVAAPQRHAHVLAGAQVRKHRRHRVREAVGIAIDGPLHRHLRKQAHGAVAGSEQAHAWLVTPRPACAAPLPCRRR